MSKKLLITGGHGQVGHEFTSFANTITCSHAELDITDPHSVEQAILRYQPDIIVNTAAYTAVDKAEQESELAFKINRDGAGIVAKLCHEHDIPLIHLSTDYVFDGKKNTPYKETDSVAPLSVYGLSKWEGEEKIRAICSQHLILRVSGVFGQYGSNFVKTILKLAKERDMLRVVADQTTCPTPAADIAKTIITLAENSTFPVGTYHYCSAPPVTWHGFAEAIVEIAKPFQTLKAQHIQAITTAEYPTAAERPKYAVLDMEKIKTEFSIMPPSWQAALYSVIPSSFI